MTAEIGVFLLILALGLSAFQASSLFLSTRMKETLSACLPIAIWLQTLLIACAFSLLMLLRIESDFSVTNVAQHSNRSLPLLYKIAGTWGNHEGSMLLWVLVLSAFGLAISTSSIHETMKRVTVSIQAALATGVLAFILFTSNPFARQFPPAMDGETLNPVLQDIALALHPPMLYVGYVGFSIVFSLAVAALLTGTSPRECARIARPWILIAWTALTFGIGLGSWWAYRELGWGGFWFWDPVENASLLPWLAGTALLHSSIVLEKRGQLASWVILLSILTFGLSLLGTFLVRSGALISVHSFASDPARGLFILLYMVVAIGSGLLLFALRSSREKTTESFTPVSREGMIVFNNLFLLSACAVVATGTLYPLLAEWISGEKLTIGAPYFNATFIPLMAFPVLFAGLAPLMPWNQANLYKTIRKALPALIAASIGGIIALASIHPKGVYTILGTALSLWLLVASVQWLLRSWKTAPRAYTMGVFLAHAGVAVFIAGITGTGGLQQETNHITTLHDTLEIAGYQLRYTEDEQVRGANFDAHRITLQVEKEGAPITTLTPEYRRYDIRGTATSEAAIYSTLTGDLYAVIGESQNKKTAVRLYYNPLVNAIWAGVLLMAAGGIAALYHLQQKRRAA